MIALTTFPRRVVRHSAFRRILPCVALCLVTGLACGQEMQLNVRPLRDAGGIERGLNVRLTTAIAHFLGENSEKSFHVETLGAFRPDAALRYTLEGELSLANGQSEENARFLLVARLYREETVRILIGQWAGTSSSLRYLTTNLRNDPGVHKLGLVGELGSRIVVALASDRTGLGQQWRSLLPHMNARNAAAIEVVTANNDKRTLKQVPAARPFQLRVRTGAAVRAYLLMSDNMGAMHIARLSTDKDALLSTGKEAAFSQPIVLPGGTSEVWAICRFAMVKESAVHIPHGRCESEVDTAPVHMLDGVGNAISTSDKDEALSSLLSEIARNPGAWRVTRLRIAERAGKAK